MIDSINTLHRLGILHGDINLNNYLVVSDESGRAIVKLTNFYKAGTLNSFKNEFINKYDDPQYDKDMLVEGNSLFLRGNYGTPVFRSPERSLCNGFPVTFISDCFSVGLCLLLIDNYNSFEKLLALNYF